MESYGNIWGKVLTKRQKMSIYGDMARYKSISEIRFATKHYPDILEMANQVGQRANENVTSLSARLLRDALTRIVAEKGLKVNTVGASCGG